MKYNHIGIPTTERFEGEIDLPHLKMTVSDHLNNPFGIQWQRYWPDAPYPELVKSVPHVAFVVDDLDQQFNRLTELKLSPAPIKEFKRDGTLLARFFFIQDPDGYKIEVLQRGGHYQ